MGDLIRLPVMGLAHTNKELADSLRTLATWLDEDRYEDLRQIVVVLESREGSLDRVTMGEPCDLARVVGVLTMAIHDAMT